MQRLLALVVVFALVCGMGLVALAQPDDKDDKGPPGKGPPPFRLGKVLPPHIAEDIDLTDAQMRQIAELEKVVAARLSKILTAKQKKMVERMGPPGKGKGFKGKDDEDGPRGKGPKDKEDDKEKLPRPKSDDNSSASANHAGIQWFATLESGRREALRTGRPILLVSAAPHCAGVSGIW